MDRVVRYYAAHWRKTGVVLVGYSQGADVLPFAINRLPSASRQLVTYAVMMGLGKKASFEFHVGNWFGGASGAIPSEAEGLKLDPAHTLARGWSITRTISGQIVRDAGDVAPGDTITTTFATGTARSRVEETST